MTRIELKSALKAMIVEVCDLDIEPEQIRDEERLINGDGELDLGSLDAVEIAAANDYEYGVRIKDLSAAKSVFKTIDSLAAHIATTKGW